MKRLVPVLGLLLLLLGSRAMAWQPTGWVYVSWPWAYDAATGDWHWFSAGAADELWVYGHPPADGWRKIQSSSLATGWSFHAWPYAYDQNNGAWFYLNEPDEQWSVNMRTQAWSVFGLPDGMARIPGGSNVGTDPAYGSYTLTVVSFYMDQCEVSKQLWDDVKAWAYAHDYSFTWGGSSKNPYHPVHTINWYDAVLWCNARSEMESRTPYYYNGSGPGATVYRSGQIMPSRLPSSNGYRLPTNTQWEYAARGGYASRRFPWNQSNDIDFNYANYYSYWSGGVPFYAYDKASPAGYHPSFQTGGEPFTARVGLFTANGYGLYDVAGNVFEWSDDWHPDYLGTHRAARGGAWNSNASYCRVGYMAPYPPTTSANYLGFRTALPVPQ